MTRFDKSTTHSRIIQFSTIERTACLRVANGYRHPVRRMSMAAINPRLQVQRTLISVLIAALTLFYPAGAIVLAEGPTPPVGDTLAASAETPPPVSPPTEPTPEPPATQPQATPEATAPQSEPPKPAAPQEPDGQEGTAPASTPAVATESLAHSQEIPVPLPPEVVDLDGDAADYAFTLDQTTSITNNINSQAGSGNATVSDNNTAGDALSGDALAMANVINMLQSSTSFSGSGGVATFSADINGDVFGDLFIDPSWLAAMQPAQVGPKGDTNLDINANLDSSIENNISLDAHSGSATVTGNNTAGDATTGNANAVLNLVNIMNSSISSGQSFVGMLNINGNLNGDILLPPGLLDTLLDSNATPTNLNASNVANSEVLAEFTDNQTITNNISTSATSGNATVSDNTTAGNATTGNALNNVTVLNLTGREVVADNSLLVFVNVLGKWVGLIMNAPQGSTSAALGTGVSQNKSNTNTTGVSVNSGQSIVNNVDVNARSGDATVSDNTAAGNATSGKATTSVNIANILNSSFGLSDWFGVLFINVFGSWNGSFGVDTDAGELPTTPPPAGGAGAVEAIQDVRVFQFRPSDGGTQHLASVEVEADGQAPAVESASTTNDTPQTEDDQGVTSGRTNWLIPLLGFAVGTVALGGERYANRRKLRKLTN